MDIPLQQHQSYNPIDICRHCWCFRACVDSFDRNELHTIFFFFLFLFNIFPNKPVSNLFKKYWKNTWLEEVFYVVDLISCSVGRSVGQTKIKIAFGHQIVWYLVNSLYPLIVFYSFFSKIVRYIHQRGVHVARFAAMFNKFI